jgi:glycosyltransferase involved in cell wall biosynthesis
MNNSKISVIVPVYNVSRYLTKCIDSILNQTFKDFELILVDDGSTDNSGTICDDYKNKYEFIKVIHTKNCGVSNARNVGIEISGGDYITFIDSDDYIDTRFLEILYKLLMEHSADIVIGGCINIRDNINIVCDCIFSGNVISKSETYRKMFMQEDIDVSPCGKLYKKNLFENLKYPVGERYEDIQIIDKIIEQCGIIVYTKYKGYFYLQHSGSFMYSTLPKEWMCLIKASLDGAANSLLI